jgi:hypothetical protein
MPHLERNGEAERERGRAKEVALIALQGSKEGPQRTGWFIHAGDNGGGGAR